MPEVTAHPTSQQPRPDPNRFEARFGRLQLAGSLMALEGGGFMQLRFEDGSAPAGTLDPGQEGVLTMHDAARFRVVVVEPLADPEEPPEKPASAQPRRYRVRLVAQEQQSG
jgi:hypothetical protein